MAFRRNFEAASSGDRRRKLLLLIGCLVLLPLLVYLIKQQYSTEPARIELQMLSNNSYIVQGNTTNFQELASTLRKVHQTAAQYEHGYEIDLSIAPSIQNTDTLRAVIQVINALDISYTIKK